MNKQRFAVIIVALIGLIATFYLGIKLYNWEQYPECLRRAGLPLSCLS